MTDRIFFPRKYLRGCQNTTRRIYEGMMAHFVDWLGDTPLVASTVDDFDALVEAKGWGNATERLCLSAIKAYFLEREIKHPLLDLSIPKLESDHRESIPYDKKQKVISACNELSPNMAIRNKAIVEVFWATGIRRFELANALLTNLDLDKGFLLVHAKAKKRKGRRPQLKKLSPIAIEALSEWLKIRTQMAHPACKTIFVSQTGRSLTEDGIGCFFKRIKQRVDFNVYAHMFRGGMATHAANKGINDRLIMKQGGWDSPDVFKMYTEQASLDAFGKLMWGKDE